MKLSVRVLVLFLLTTPAVFAGQISGRIQNADGSALVGGNITITCSGSPTKGKTDGDGRYSIAVPKTGACSFKVNDKTPVKIFSSKQPTRYDFRIRGSKLRKR